MDNIDAFGIPILLMILFIVLIYLIIIAYLNIFFRPNIFGRTFSVSFFTLGIASIIEPKFFKALFVFPAQLMLFVSTGIFKWVNNLSKSSEDPEYVLGLDYLGSFTDGFFHSIIDNLLIREVIIGLIIAGLLQAILFWMFFDKNSGRYLIGSKLKAIYKSSGMLLSDKLKQNLGLVALMLASLYLVLCVTIAIPYNEEDIVARNSDLKEDSSRPVLPVGYLGSSLQLNMDNFKEDTLNLFDKIKRSISDTFAFSPAKALLETNNNILQNTIRDQYSNLEKRITKFNNSLAYFDTSLRQHVKSLEKKIIHTEGSARLKKKYQKDLQIYLENEIDYYYAVFQNERTQIENELFYFIRRNIQELLLKYDGFVEELRRFSNENPPPPYFNNYFSLANTPFQSFVNRPLFTVFATAPKPPNPGDEWGWPGSVAGWLILPKNADIVLLFGMFGFGMLGAAISSFVNIQINGNSTLPLVRDVHIVVIRGFAAAIVIFLATKGGIAIVNNGASNPDPYVLFFTCLVGAVFSERIWEWAKSHISQRYDKNNPASNIDSDSSDPYLNDTDDSKLPPSMVAPPPGAIPL